MEKSYEYYKLAYLGEENESAIQNIFEEKIEEYTNGLEDPLNSFLTGLREQISQDNQGLPSSKENDEDEEKIAQSNIQVTLISKNKNSHKNKKIMLDLNGTTTNYQSNGTKSNSMKKKKSRREHRINSAGAGCLNEIHKYLNNICGKYSLELEHPNFQNLFCGNIKYHLQFIHAKIYQIFIHNRPKNDKVISKMVKEIKNKKFNYIINLTFDFIYKKYIEEKNDNDMLIDENEKNKEIGIRTLKQVVEERKKALEKKEIVTEEDIEKIDDFEFNSKNFFVELKNIEMRENCQEPKFHFEVIPYIENLK